MEPEIRANVVIMNSNNIHFGSSSTIVSYPFQL